MTTFSGKQWTLPDFKGIQSLTLTDGPTYNSSTLGPFDVLVKIKAISLNYRDLIISDGTYPMTLKPGVIPGSDASATVVGVGPQVQEFKPGDHVVTLFWQDHQAGLITPRAFESGLGANLDGPFREYAVYPESGLVHAPKHLSYEQAATLSCAALTVWNALYGLRPLHPGETVLVQGTGGVSVFGLQFAKAAGARVIATTSSEEKAKWYKKMGADEVIDYRRTPEWGIEAKRLTDGGEGVDHILEVGGSGTLGQSVKAIKLEGIISLIGFLANKGERGDDVDFLGLLQRVCIARGIGVGSRLQMQAMVKAMEVNGIVPVVDEKVWEFEELPKAYQHLWDHKHIGKVVIRVDRSEG